MSDLGNKDAREARYQAAEDGEEPVRATGLTNLVVDTLFALTNSPQGMSIRAIAEETNNSRSSAHRILQSLSRGDFVQQTDNGGYVVGPRLLLLAARTFGVVPVLKVVNLAMQELVKEVGETAYFAVFSESDSLLTYLHRVESDHPVRHMQPLGLRIPLHAGAVGKAILSELEDFDLCQLSLEAFTPHTLTSIDALQRDLEGVRRRRFATSDGERVVGVGGVASVVVSGGKLLGALTISVPKSRFPAKGIEVLGETVLKYAETLSETLTSMGVKRI